MASMASYPDGDVCSMARRGKKTLAAIRVQRQQRPVLAQRVGLARAAALQDGLREVVDGVADDGGDAIIKRRELGAAQGRAPWGSMSPRGFLGETIVPPKSHHELGMGVP